jgi:hypothetical protein
VPDDIEVDNGFTIILQKDNPQFINLEQARQHFPKK